MVDVRIHGPEVGRMYVKAARRRRGLLKILINSGYCGGFDADYDGIVGSRWGGLCGSQSGFWRVTNGEYHRRVRACGPRRCRRNYWPL